VVIREILSLILYRNYLGKKILTIIRKSELNPEKMNLPRKAGMRSTFYR